MNETPIEHVISDDDLLCIEALLNNKPVTGAGVPIGDRIRRLIHDLRARVAMEAEAKAAFERWQEGAQVTRPAPIIGPGAKGSDPIEWPAKPRDPDARLAPGDARCQCSACRSERGELGGGPFAHPVGKCSCPDCIQAAEMMGIKVLDQCLQDLNAYKRPDPVEPERPSMSEMRRQQIVKDRGTIADLRRENERLHKLLNSKNEVIESLHSKIRVGEEHLKNLDSDFGKLEQDRIDLQNECLTLRHQCDVNSRAVAKANEERVAAVESVEKWKGYYQDRNAEIERQQGVITKITDENITLRRKNDECSRGWSVEATKFNNLSELLFAQIPIPSAQAMIRRAVEGAVTQPAFQADAVPTFPKP